jgi:hypothetical protein
MLFDKNSPVLKDTIFHKYLPLNIHTISHESQRLSGTLPIPILVETLSLIVPINILTIDIVNLVVVNNGRSYVVDFINPLIGQLVVNSIAARSIIPFIIRIMSFLFLNPSVSLIAKVSALACIRAFVLEVRLDKFFNGPAMWEPVKVSVTLTCLEYNILRKKKENEF